MNKRSNFDRSPASEYVHKMYLIEQAEDDAIREDPALRLECVQMVEQFADLLKDAAGRLAVARDENTAFGEDLAREHLLWNFIEFLTMGSFNREDRPGLIQHWQLDREHAAEEFGIEIMSDGSLQPVTE